MCRKMLCYLVGCLLLTATTALAADPSEIGATPIPLPTPPRSSGINYLGPQPEPPDKPAEFRPVPFEWFMKWLFDFGR